MSSSKMSFEKITDTEIAKANIASLSDRPNSSSRYGIGDLSAQDLKKRFDAFPELVKEKLNAIITALSSADAAKYITLNYPNSPIENVDNLYDFFALFGEKNAEKKENVSDYINVLYAKLTDADRKNYTLQDVVDDLSAWMVTFTDKKSSDYDMIIESDGEFSKCLYPLFKDEDVLTKSSAAASFETGTASLGTPSVEFTARRILVKDVTFKIPRGYDDVRMHVFQPSLKYIKFENCRWETEWWVSGKRPTVLAAGGSQFGRAPGDLDLTIEGIEVTADNVQAAKDAGAYWYIGLRNIKALLNSEVLYPEGYDIANGWGFKLTCQYFDYASGNRVPALWDGGNVSDCYICERLVRCTGCVNVIAAPLLKDTEENGVIVDHCDGISNFRGHFFYNGCSAVDFDSCDGIDNRYTLYDYIIRNTTELTDILATRSLTGRRLLLRDFTLSSSKLDFKWAGYVGFSNMLFGADITLSNVWELNGAGLDAALNKWSVTITGGGRARVYNVGRLPGSKTESKYIYENCASISNSIIGGAKGCKAIHGCYIALDADVTIEGCIDICGITVVPSGRTAALTFYGCYNISHVKKNGGTGAINYSSCGGVDLFTCDGYKLSSNTYGGVTVPVQRSDGTRTVAYGRADPGGGFFVQRVGDGNIKVPSEPSASDHAISWGKAQKSFPALVGGKIPSDYLPSYVDDVIEGYYHNNLIYGKFFSADERPDLLDPRYTPESGKIYVDIWTNKSYRWGGESVGYVEITGGGVSLGETSSTAYRGDRGKAAYEHSETSGNPHGTTAENVGAVGKLAWSAAGTDYRVYAQDNSAGTEVALWASEGATHAGAEKTIPLRDASGRLVVAAPSASNHAATKGYVDNTFFAKPLEGDMVYRNTYYMPVSRLEPVANGHKKVEEFIVTPKEPSTMVAGAVVLRDLNKQIFVPITPTVNGHAASKKYVEDYVAGYARGESFEQIVYCTSSPHFTIPLFSDGTLFRGVIIPVDNSGTYDILHGGTSFEVYIPPQMACTIHSNVFWLNFVRADSGGIEGYRRAYLEVEVNSTDYEEAGCKLFYFNADDTISDGTTLLAHSYYKVIGKLIHA